MALPNVKKGDIFAVRLTNGLGFIQCVKEASRTDLEIIRAISGAVNDIETSDVDYIYKKKELFFALFPVKYAMKDKMISFIGNFSIPIGSEAPKYFRAKHIVRSEFLGWHIVEAETWQRRLVHSLSHEELLLSPWGTLSIPDLVERIESNWSPTDWK